MENSQKWLKLGKMTLNLTV